MRWDTLRLSGDGSSSGAAQPALFERAAITRTFDTPGFRGMTFHEVHARSIISKVPEASRVPFRWTINPYRGCSHACRYCVAGETPVLMADGRTKPISELRQGDAVYGTVRRGSCRRYVETTVLAHWQTVKRAYRVTLQDGTTLVASGDHRFLTGRGWKYVTGAEQGSSRRPHLTLNSGLLGVGAFAEQPKDSADYRRGYLCGMIRGDAHVLADGQALDRTSRYLAELGISTAEFTWAEAGAARPPVRAILTSAREHARAAHRVAGWPAAASADWRKGFLAGIFDAAGSCSRGTLRISSTDRSVIARTKSCLAFLGFEVAEERDTSVDGLIVLRLGGGLSERLRFFHSTDPAVSCKLTIDGMAVEGDARLTVVSIEPLGLEVPMYDITTGTGDFIANGVVSHNCFARNTHTYLDMDAGHDFDSQIVVKVNAVELLRKELAAPRWRGEHIAMGTNVDCYQRAEGRYQLMPGIIQALTQTANPFSILTKGTLVLRDIDLLAAAAEVTDVGLNVSVGIIDKELSRLLESGTPAPGRRLAACAELNQRGLPCGVLMGPVIPYLSDSPAQLDQAVMAIAASGATHVTPIVLHLRPGAREWFLSWLREHHPELVGAYADLYGSRAYAPAGYQRKIADQVAELAARHGVGQASPAAARRLPAAQRDRRRRAGSNWPEGLGPRRADTAAPAPAPPNEEQLPLL